MNFNDIFRKNVNCDNIKIHKRTELCPLSRKHNFGKTTGGLGLSGKRIMTAQKQNKETRDQRQKH